MTYTDAQGRPEIVMHPDILRGTAAYRFVGPASDGAGALHDMEDVPVHNASGSLAIIGEPVAGKRGPEAQ